MAENEEDVTTSEEIGEEIAAEEETATEAAAPEEEIAVQEAAPTEEEPAAEEDVPEEESAEEGSASEEEIDAEEEAAEEEATQEEADAEETEGELLELSEEQVAPVEEPDHKTPMSTVVHWTVHVIMAVAIVVLGVLLYTNVSELNYLNSDEGKLSQDYGKDEAHEIATTFANHDWESLGIDLDTYAYYYDMYNQYFEVYEDQYAEMGISNMTDLMDAMYEDTVSYYSTDTTSTDTTTDSTTTDSTTTDSTTTESTTTDSTSSTSTN